MSTYYKKYLVAFIINAIIIAAVSAISIETRLSIKEKKNKLRINNDTLIDTILYYLHMFPFYISERFGLLTHRQMVPEYINALYLFFITFFVALIVLHFVLFLVGKGNMYHYYFGNIRLININ